MGQAGRPTRAGKPLVSSAVGQPEHAQTTCLRCICRLCPCHRSLLTGPGNRAVREGKERFTEGYRGHHSLFAKWREFSLVVFLQLILS